MLVKTKDGKKDVALTEVTPDNYIVDDNEKGLYHYLIEQKQFDPKTGKRLSVPRIQKTGPKMFDSVTRPNLANHGFDIEVLHDPNKWLAKNQEKESELAKQREEASLAKKQEAEAKAEADRKKEVDDAVKAALEAANKETDKKIAEAVNQALKAAGIGKAESAEKPAKADENAKGSK